jgi:hypothetical protein
MAQQIIHLSLELNEVNLIIKALSERPFREVYELVGKIHAQSNTQLSEKKDREP